MCKYKKIFDYLDEDYQELCELRSRYQQDRDMDTYSELVSVYMYIDAHLKSALSIGEITMDDLTYIRGELLSGWY